MDIFDAYERGFQASVMGFPCHTELDSFLGVAWIDGWIDGEDAEGIPAWEFDEIVEYMRIYNQLGQ
jgi:hypothetical protein